MDDSNTTLVILAFIAIAILLLQFLILIIRAKFFWKDFSDQNPKVLPNVSILVTSRNEEKDLPKLLKSFELLDYPSDKMEFFLADDSSEDDTFKILDAWSSKKNNCRIFKLEDNSSYGSHLNGKAKALATMAREAHGDFLFFTDADCEVSKDWVREGVSCFSGKIGLLNGVTEINATSIFAQFQKIDWWNILSITKVVSDMGRHTTGLGNNMVISKQAYLKSGGFESTPFSWTEDLAISRLIVESGFQVHQQVSEGMLVKTKAEKDWIKLLTQRKRWLKGALSLPWIWKIALSFPLIFFPAIFYLIAWNPVIGVGLWIFKILLQFLFLNFLSSKSGSKLNWIGLTFYDFYYLLSSSLTILYYFWPSKITWKSRNYS